jgi:hypothetical protein
MPDSPTLSRRQFIAATGALALPGLALGKDPDKPKLAARTADSVQRGLDWLKREQARDGSWGASGGQYRSAMTALAGMCFLMEGSTLKEGKYTEQVRKAVEWCVAPKRLQPNGLIADRQDGGGFDNYMHGHGYATMFLACAYGESEDAEEQRKLEKALTQAVAFTCKAQSLKKHKKAEGKEVEIGGWGYVSADDGRNFDEGSVTITALQALRAARNATIPVPKANLDRAVAYLEACTTPKGGIIYSYTSSNGQARNGEERAPLTAAAICCGFSAGQYGGELPKRWIKYCKDHIPVAKGRVAHDEYQNYYQAQYMYALGETRYAELFPNEPKESRQTWIKYRDIMYPYLIDQQQKSGEWTTGHIGPVYATTVNLTILLLERNMLPIYQR